MDIAQVNGKLGREWAGHQLGESQALFVLRV